MRNDLSLARKTYRAEWSRYASLGAVALVGVLFYWATHRPDGESAPAPPRPKEPPPAIAPSAPQATLEERAAEVRRRALHECDLGHWKPCLEGLDEARTLDPAGDATPPIELARERASKAMTGEGK